MTNTDFRQKSPQDQIPKTKRRKLNSISYLALVICYWLFLILPPVSFLSPVSASNPAAIGIINNSNLPKIPSGGENSFVAGIVRNGIQLLLIVAFIIDFIWIILAGFQFIFAGGDPKNISTAWSRIYWGLIGMAIVMSSFAIIKLVEIFFGINLISGGLSLPRI